MANVTKKREPGESFTEWMARKAQLEKDKFAIDLEMKPFVEKQQATIGAVVHSISRGYSWHVAHNWLPLTAKRLLAVWFACSRACLSELCPSRSRSPSPSLPPSLSLSLFVALCLSRFPKPKCPRWTGCCEEPAEHHECRSRDYTGGGEP